MPKKILETSRISEAAADQAADSGRMLIQFITPGWGSSGYYSPTVLEQAAADKVIPAGTHMYADHPTEAEDLERPIRSIKDLMAVTVEDARLTAEGALVGEVDVVPAWRDLVKTVRNSIGVSIRGSATDIVEGEAEGRRGGIVEGLVAPVVSVDFVTRAGRGGRVLSVLESARANQRALQRGLAEATVNDTRDALQTTLRDQHNDPDVWVYVRDFDATTVWFEIDGGDQTGIYAQTYTNTDGAVALTGQPVEVRVVTTYVPATRPDSPTPTKESEEDTMPKIEIEESEHTRLLEQSGRVQTLEAELATERARGDKAESDLAQRDLHEAATKVIADHDTEFTALEARGLLADIPVHESGDQVGQLDTDKFTAAVNEAAALKAQADGSGRITGFGQHTDTGTAPATEAATTNPWGRPLTEQKGA